MGHVVAIVGMACHYPEARSPVDLWENVLAKRRAFRRIPDERLRLDDYFSPDPDAPDRIYLSSAAVIEGYEFNRERFRIAGSTFRSADLTHWLALDVADRALEDAGLAGGEGLPREETGVFVGNTLTGEFSRSNAMRLRWPYVRRVLGAALMDEGWSSERSKTFLAKVEEGYKNPFPPVTEETLSGNLSNTIAGRICNYFDLKGGGYTVDGACASSLLAIINACSAITSGDLSVALAGGIDLSLDPFELVGFAKTLALAADEMRVYDAHSSGFWPGEGCGFVVLMRYDEAIERGLRVYSTIEGWGISSDGGGGLTRPGVEGQALALRRAYRRAGVGIHSVGYFEGHGTGTRVGDATELASVSLARREATPEAPPAVIGSIKANIGHTKAAAGVAGLIKAAMALYTQILPPTTGCTTPHPELSGEKPALRVLDEGELWPSNLPLRAGVSAMGFGGINTHLILSGVHSERRRYLTAHEAALISSYQDTEIFLICARDRTRLLQLVDRLLSMAPRLSISELSDLSAHLASSLEDRRVRAAVIASTPQQLVAGLETLRERVVDGVSKRLDIHAGVFVDSGPASASIGFLFPGQGSPVYFGGGAMGRRYPFLKELFGGFKRFDKGEGVATEVAQPAIVSSSLAALRILNLFGMTAEIGVGHSLGEITALCWSGSLTEEAALRIACARGRAMAAKESVSGAMACIGAGRKEVEDLLKADPVAIAGLNSPGQTVVSGETSAITSVIRRCEGRGIRAVRLPVSNAFHSPLMADAAPAVAAHLAREEFRPLQRPVVSTVTANRLTADQDLRALLYRQITSPVQFMDAATLAAREVDLFIEVGPGQVLSSLVAEFVDKPVIALDSCGPSLKGLLQAVGAAFVLGSDVDPALLYSGRFTRPFGSEWQPRFFANPCELAPISQTNSGLDSVEEHYAPVVNGERKLEDGLLIGASESSVPAPIEVIRRLVAERTELPGASVKDNSRMLHDLHLNSITVSQIVAQAAKQFGLRRPSSPLDYSNATVAEIAQVLEELVRVGCADLKEARGSPAAGVDSWVRCFTVELVEQPLKRHPVEAGEGEWRVFAPPDYPLAEGLEQALGRCGKGKGVVACLPPGPCDAHLPLLLEACKAALSRRETERFVLIQHQGGGASFVRSLHLENPELITCVIDMPLMPEAVDWAIEEIKNATGYTEAHYDCSGLRRAPFLRLLPEGEGSLESQPGPSDVLLVTGGGKGISAECALAIARATGAKLLLLGRSDPSSDSELSENLKRITAYGIESQYGVADVLDPSAVTSAVAEGERVLGPVTGILHGAAINTPCLIRSLDLRELRGTVATKVQGLENLLSAVDQSRLRLLISFGSIIARTGLPGEAHYALANEWLTRLTEKFRNDHPNCRCLAIEWSAWADVGMAQRVGSLEHLVEAGITPITTEVGLGVLRSLLSRESAAPAVVVTGRYGDLPTLKMEQRDLPLLRFLERPRVYYPGVELIVDCELTPDTDPYLAEHILEGEVLFPAVMGLEAMAQAAMAVSGSEKPPEFGQVEFLRPVVIDGAKITLRIAALVREPGVVEVALRSGDTAYQADHFRAICRFNESSPQTTINPSEWRNGDKRSIAMESEGDLYGNILFQAGRFAQVRGYQKLVAAECVAEIGSGEQVDWFGAYMPQEMVLGNAGARDAAIHSIQACIPHMRVLPVGADRISAASLPSDSFFLHAHERSRDGDIFSYDLEIAREDGVVIERWENLRLKVVSSRPASADWAAPLLRPYIERRIQEFIPGSNVSVALDVGPGSRRGSDREQALRAVAGESITIVRRFDGKPELTDVDGSISASHSGAVTLIAYGGPILACDIEAVVQRPVAEWGDLLGPERVALAEFIAREMGEGLDVAATRIWSAVECMNKVGLMLTAPLVFKNSTVDGWVILSSGSLGVAIYVSGIKGVTLPQSIALLVSGDPVNRQNCFESIGK